MDLVSIIVPVYNTSKYLPQCLDSILRQTVPDFEVICVNDSSTDNSLKILQNYADKDSRIKVYSKENGGISSVRNFGMTKSGGKFICFLDSDDYIHPQFLEIMLKEIGDKNICCCDYEDVDDEHVVSFARIKEYSLHSADALQYFATCKDQYLAVWGKMYRADCLKNATFHENCCFSEDVLFHSDLFTENFAINIISAPLQYYRKNPQSLVHKKSSINKINSLLFVAEHVYKKYNSHKLWKQIYKNRVAKSVSNALKYLEKCDEKKQIYPLIKKLYKQQIIRFTGLSFSKKIMLLKILLKEN